MKRSKRAETNSKSNTLSGHLTGENMTNKMTLLAAALIASPMFSAAVANAAEWRLIGRTQASHSADHDAIVVPGPFDTAGREQQTCGVRNEIVP